MLTWNIKVKWQWPCWIKCALCHDAIKKCLNSHNVKSEKTLTSDARTSMGTKLRFFWGLRPEKKQKVEKSLKVWVNTKKPDKMRHMKWCVKKMVPFCVSLSVLY